jgi:hypothetical protein
MLVADRHVPGTTPGWWTADETRFTTRVVLPRTGGWLVVHHTGSPTAGGSPAARRNSPAWALPRDGFLTGRPLLQTWSGDPVVASLDLSSIFLRRSGTDLVSLADPGFCGAGLRCLKGGLRRLAVQFLHCPVHQYGHQARSCG